MSTAWRLRPASDADLAAIVEVGRAETIALVGFSDRDLTTVRQQIAADPNFDVRDDILVAEVDSEVIGYAIINPRHANFAVRPGSELDGLSAALLAWTESRQIELGRSPLRCGTLASHPVQAALLERHGYELERFYARMARDFATTPPLEAARVPHGYRLRPMDRDSDARAIHALDDRAFSVVPDYEPESFEEFVGRHLGLSAFAPEWSLIVEAPGGELAGALVGTRTTQRSNGHVLLLMVNPDHQRRGLGRILLLSAFAAIRDAGLTSADLDVASDNPRALDLYTSVGMTEQMRTNTYRRNP